MAGRRCGGWRSAAWSADGEHDSRARSPTRWIRRPELFARQRKLVEKYDVTGEAEAGGGEYPLQDGFGWTNGCSAPCSRVTRHRRAALISVARRSPGTPPGERTICHSWISRARKQAIDPAGSSATSAGSCHSAPAAAATPARCCARPAGCGRSRRRSCASPRSEATFQRLVICAAEGSIELGKMYLAIRGRCGAAGIGADGVQQEQPIGRQAAPGHVEVGGVVAHAHVLEHADRDDPVEAFVKPA